MKTWTIIAACLLAGTAGAQTETWKISDQHGALGQGSYTARLAARQYSQYELMLACASRGEPAVLVTNTGLDHEHVATRYFAGALEGGRRPGRE